jgi:hypothetical protein
VGVFEKSDRIADDLSLRQRAKPAGRQTRMLAQIYSQVSLIGVTGFGCNLR